MWEENMGTGTQVDKVTFGSLLKCHLVRKPFPDAVKTPHPFLYEALGIKWKIRWHSSPQGVPATGWVEATNQVTLTFHRPCNQSPAGMAWDADKNSQD